MTVMDGGNATGLSGTTLGHRKASTENTAGSASNRFRVEPGMTAGLELPSYLNLKNPVIPASEPESIKKKALEVLWTPFSLGRDCC